MPNAPGVDTSDRETVSTSVTIEVQGVGGGLHSTHEKRELLFLKNLP